MDRRVSDRDAEYRVLGAILVGWDSVGRDSVGWDAGRDRAARRRAFAFEWTAVRRACGRAALAAAGVQTTPTHAASASEAIHWHGH
jgi:hypothetical protein